MQSFQLSPNKNLPQNEQARDKNREEYNSTAAAYDEWQASNVLMQHYCYYSSMNEIEKEGIEGKTFLEVGCGPCPVGQRLAKKGAKKIYGLDISQLMIDDAVANLTKLGMADKFELICADIFDEKFTLPEQVDCVVLSYTVSTFINNMEMLSDILLHCRRQMKPDGMVLLSDFCWVEQPKDDWFFGMFTSTQNGKTPEVWQPFKFHIVTAPDASFEIFHIPPHVMFNAGIKAGFRNINWMSQYPDPEFAQDKVIRRYLDECNPSDYIIKFKN